MLDAANRKKVGRSQKEGLSLKEIMEARKEEVRSGHGRMKGEVVLGVGQARYTP